MTRYLQRLIARISDGSEVRPLVPFIRTAFRADGGEVADPFENTAQTPPQASAPQASGSDPSAAGWVSQQRGESSLPESTATGSSGATMPPAPDLAMGDPFESTARPPHNTSAPPAPGSDQSGAELSGAAMAPVPDLATEPLRRTHDRVADPTIRQSSPSVMEAVPDPGSAGRARRPPDEGPAPGASTPTTIIEAANPTLVEQADSRGPARLRAQATSPALRPPGEVAGEHETEASRRLSAEPLMPAMTPDEERKRPTERPGSDLRPPTPAPAPLIPRVPGQPRVVIGRLRVEVVPGPLATPETTPARPSQRRAIAPKRSEPSRSKLRFGLGQM